MVFSHFVILNFSEIKNAQSINKKQKRDMDRKKKELEQQAKELAQNALERRSLIDEIEKVCIHSYKLHKTSLEPISHLLLENPS